MGPKKAVVPARFARREFLEMGAALAGLAGAGPLLAQQPPATAPSPRVKGPIVWLDMDQEELDAAYDQIKYAPNLPQITKRYATNSEAALQGSCGERRVGADARGGIVKAGLIRRRVRLRTVQKRCPDTCDAITLVRKRTLRYAVESTISNLAELRCLA